MPPPLREQVYYWACYWSNATKKCNRRDTSLTRDLNTNS